MLTRYKSFYPIEKNFNINPTINFILSFQLYDASKFYTIIKMILRIKNEK